MLNNIIRTDYLAFVSSIPGVNWLYGCMCLVRPDIVSSIKSGHNIFRFCARHYWCKLDIWWHFYKTRSIRIGRFEHKHFFLSSLSSFLLLSFFTLCIPAQSVCGAWSTVCPGSCLSSVADWSDHMCANIEHTVSSRSAVWRHWQSTVPSAWLREATCTLL